MNNNYRRPAVTGEKRAISRNSKNQRLGRQKGRKLMKKFFKKLTAAVAAATMVMAMGVTVFAAGDSEALANGKYTANQNLYKNEACTNPSMGDKALNDMKADITIRGSKAILVVHTHEITYLGLTGHLGEMVINGETGKIGETTTNGVKDYTFTFTNLDASTFYEGCVITGQFTTYVGDMPMKATGYLKLTNITVK